jgi:hypothetical protein
VKPRPLTFRSVGSIALLTIAAGLLAQIAYNGAMAYLGYDYPYTLFLFAPADRWADFFKLVFSLDGPPIRSPEMAWAVQPHIDELRRMAETYSGPLNPDHMPPLPTLLAVSAREAFGVIDPAALFAALISIGLFAMAVTVSSSAPEGEGMRWAAAGLLSYPVLFMADRGHFFSLICGVTLIAGSWRVLTRKRFDPVAIVLLAVAINLRPNVAIVPILLVLAGRVGRFRDLVLLGIAGAALLLLCMAAASALYPHYGWQTWLQGLQDYRANYVEQPQSFGFQTSLPLVAELAGLPSWAAIGLCAAAAGAVGMAAIMLARIGRLPDSALAFIAIALMPLVVPAFADYHLIPFLLPLLLLAREGGPKTARDWIVLIATLLVLIPKNYAYGDANYFTAWSYQILLNPLLLLLAAGAVLTMAWRDGEAAARTI